MKKLRSAFVDSFTHPVKCFGILILPFLFLTLGCEGKAKSSVFADNGKANVVIALATDATPAETKAAAELAEYLKKISGAEFTIQGEATLAKDTPAILVGNGAEAKRLLPDIKWDQLKDDEIIIKTVGDKLILAGQRPRGSLYAVYNFLQDALGVNWWTPSAETVPSVTRLEVPAQNTIYTPPFFYRQVYAAVMEHAGPLFPTRMKNNGESGKQSAELGGYHSSLGGGHTWFTVLPPDKYFAAHPEWYTDPANGGKPCTAGSPAPTDSTSQLCLTNPEMKAEFIKNTLKWISENPGIDVINLTQMDNVTRCQCDNCLLLEEAQESPSGPVIQFTNEVAEAVAKEFPRVKLKTLAYLYSLKAPKSLKVNDNVVVQVCIGDESFDGSRPVNSEKNAVVRDTVKAWAKVAPNLAIWDYVTSFRLDIYPFPNLRTLGDNARFYAENHAVSYFSQSDVWTSGAAYFTLMKAWVISQLMWDPTLDSDKLITKFVNGYYGKAGPYMRQYIDLMEDAIVASGERLEWYPNRNKFLTLEVMNKATELFKQAQEAVAGDTTYSPRLELTKLSLDMAWIINYKTLRAEADATKAEFKGPENIVEFIKGVGETAKAFQVNSYGEWAALPPLIRGLQTWFGSSGTVPDDVKAYFPPETNLDGAIVTSVDDWFLGNWGRQLTEKRVDPATGKEVGYMFPGHMDWAMGYPYGEYAKLASKKKNARFHIYLIARVDAAEDAPLEKNAMLCGVYRKKDGPATPGEQDAEIELDKIARSTFKTYQEIAGPTYKVIDLGAFPTTAGSSIYIAPFIDPANKGVYVYRILLVPEKEVPIAKTE